jgi:hypothetical protein
MRRWLAFSVALVGVAALVAAPAAAQSPIPQSPMPYIVAMAQHFVQNRLMTSTARDSYHIEFDQSFVYSQPRKTLWVVVGGYVSDQNDFNSFTAAVLLDCPEFQKVECWSLEKLSINGKIVLDRKRI